MPISYLFDLVARRAGYVRRKEMTAAVDAVTRDKELTENELRHKTRSLEHQIALRDRLEREVEFMRELELAQTRGDSRTQRSIGRLDRAIDFLLENLRETWPSAYEFTLSTEATQEALAAVGKA